MVYIFRKEFSDEWTCGVEADSLEEAIEKAYDADWDQTDKPLLISYQYKAVPDDEDEDEYDFEDVPR